MDIFLQVLQNFQNKAVFKNIFKNPFLFWKLHVFKIYKFSLSQFNFIFRKEL